MTLQSNPTFRASLTIHEAAIFDAVREKGFVVRQEIADELNISVSLADKLYVRAFDKFRKYATRTEM